MTVQTCTPQWHVYEGAPTFDQPCRCGAVKFTGWGGATEPVVTRWQCAGCDRDLTDYSPHALDADGRPYCPECNE